jgi:hypothetical protein
MQPLLYCKLGNMRCRHCSDGIKKHIGYVGVIKTGAYEKRETCIDRGIYCNNECDYIAHMLKCPIPDALAVPLKQPEISELDWMRRKTSF